MQIKETHHQSPNMKGLFFVKTNPIFNKYARYIEREGVNVINGIEYMPDEKIRAEVAEAVTKSKAISSLSEKTDVFINVIEKEIEKSPFPNMRYISYLRMWYLDTKDKAVRHFEILKTSAGSPEHTKKEMVDSINAIKFI